MYSVLCFLQDHFTKASKSLYIATKHRAFFRKITIWIPKTWPNSHTTHGPAGSETFESAHVRIDKSSNGDNTPFVLQPDDECGVQGLFMLLTPQYLVEKNEQQNIGDPGKRTITIFPLSFL